MKTIAQMLFGLLLMALGYWACRSGLTLHDGRFPWWSSFAFMFGILVGVIGALGIVITVGEYLQERTDRKGGGK